MSNTRKRNKWENKMIKKRCINKDASTSSGYYPVNFISLRRTRKVHGKSTNSISKDIRAGSKCYYRNIHRKENMKLSQIMCDNYLYQDEYTMNDYDESTQDEIIINQWICNKCTFNNMNGTEICEMCQNPAPIDHSVKCIKCTYLNTANSTICAVCNYRLEHERADIVETIGIDINYKVKRKHRKQNSRKKRRRRRKKMDNMDNNFKEYWTTMKHSNHEYETLQIKRQKYDRKQKQKYILTKGKFSKSMKLNVHIYCQEKGGWDRWGIESFPSSIKENQTFVCQRDIDLTQTVRINMLYFIQNPCDIENNYKYHPLSIKLYRDAYNQLMRNKVLGQAINSIRNISVNDVSDTNIDEYFKKHNIAEYMKKNDKALLPPTVYAQSLSFNILLTLHEGTEYEYLYNNIRMVKKKGCCVVTYPFVTDSSFVLTNVPMKLKNFTLEQCKINIHDNIRDIDTVYNFFSDPETGINIPLYSCAYQSVYGADEYPAIHSILQNNRLRNILTECIGKIGEFPMDKLMRNLKFDVCHEPYYNLLPISFRLSRILIDYLPIKHILKRILIPYVGYNTMHYVMMETDIKYETEQENIDYYENHDSDDMSDYIDDTDDENDGEYDDDKVAKESGYREWKLSDFIKKKRNEADIIENNRNTVLLKVDGHEFVDDLTDTEDDDDYYGSNESSVFVDLFGTQSDDDWYSQ